MVCTWVLINSLRSLRYFSFFFFKDWLVWKAQLQTESKRIRDKQRKRDLVLLLFSPNRSSSQDRAKPCLGIWKHIWVFQRDGRGLSTWTNFWCFPRHICSLSWIRSRTVKAGSTTHTGGLGLTSCTITRALPVFFLSYDLSDLLFRDLSQQLSHFLTDSSKPLQGLLPKTTSALLDICDSGILALASSCLRSGKVYVSTQLGASVAHQPITDAFVCSDWSKSLGFSMINKRKTAQDLPTHLCVLSL